MFNFFPKSAAPATPPAHLEVDGAPAPVTADLVARAVQGWEIKQRIDALEQELKRITTDLSDRLGAGTALVVDGLCRVTVSPRQTVTLMDPDRCRDLLGGRFDDLVLETTRYTASDKLKGIALDPDHPLSEPLRPCLRIDDSITVSFRPVAPAANR